MKHFQFSEEEYAVFLSEALELLESAEDSLLLVDKGYPLQSHYECLFRAFHSLKGGAGMFQMVNLQRVMHTLEDQLQSQKSIGVLTNSQVSYFLDGIDGARKLLNGEVFELNKTFPVASPTEAVSRLSSKREMNSKSDPQAHEEKVPRDIISPSPEIASLMVIDDEPLIVEVISDILTSHGFHVYGFTSPLEAVKKFAEIDVQAIFCDMKMPEMTGIQVLAEIKKMDGEIPFVFVSAYLNKEELIEALNLGATGVIEKPIVEAMVISSAHTATRRYQLFRLLKRSLDFIMYQYSALDEFLQQSGQNDVRQLLIKEIQGLLETRRQIRSNPFGIKKSA